MNEHNVVTCTRCGFRCNESEADEWFYERSDRAVKRWRSWCRDCASRTNAAYTATHRDERNEYQRKHVPGTQNPPRTLTTEEIRERDRIRSKSETTRVRRRSERGREVRRNNEAKRRANKSGDLTVEQWLWIRDVLWEDCCAYCGCKFSPDNPATQDHVIPVSLGGPHTASNVVPACRSCNSKKGAKIHHG